MSPLATSTSRKVQQDRENAVLLLFGLGVCLYFKADPQTYLIYCGSIVGKGWVFTQGLGKEYAMKAQIAAKTGTPQE